MNPFALAWVHFRIGAMNELQYRANFFIQLFQSALALGTGLVAIALVFSHTEDLEGWSQAELLAVMGIHIAIGGVINAWVQPNMTRLMKDVREGTFDYVLTKPADSQVLVSVRQLAIWHSVDLIVGGLVLAYAITQLGSAVGLLQAGAFAAAVAMGVVMIYCIWLMVTTIAFRVVDVEQIVILFQGIYQAGRWPVSIYPLWLRGTLTFLIPLAFAVTVPAEALRDRLGGPLLALTFAVAVAFVLITRLVWRVNVNKYSGASA